MRAKRLGVGLAIPINDASDRFPFPCYVPLADQVLLKLGSLLCMDEQGRRSLIALGHMSKRTRLSTVDGNYSAIKCPDCSKVFILSDAKALGATVFNSITPLTTSYSLTVTMHARVVIVFGANGTQGTAELLIMHEIIMHNA
ncbi:hypothetical protein PAXRUDRAFT_734623 [Paxillus rubicundulus Ve08.2h10]|uniref:Uncharacterized protein n=1 Tax=Paxillus rubicundulus Ve08.2h10 TaxID=930991 RepID=A0A0D0DR35_9AGAM|nr:hypothetical protein PAXRUDRAFT_734623 [Paxillus rubicundulus Ve08.2h10]